MWKISARRSNPVSGRAPSGSSKNGAMSACQRALTPVALHRPLCRGEVLALQVADQEAVGAQEQRVVAPPGPAERVEHLGPYLAVALPVLGQSISAHRELEAHTLHELTPG